MKIANVEASQIFGRNYHLAPECPVVVITGPNEAGKTSLLSLPRLAVTPAPVSKFVLLGQSPDRFQVVLKYDDGTLVDRQVKRGKHTLALNGERGTPRNVQPLVDNLVGEAFGWSFQQLLGMTPAARLEWLEANILDSQGRDFRQQVAPYVARINHIMGSEIVPPDVEITRERLVAYLDTLKAEDKAVNRDANRLHKVVAHDEKEAAAVDLPPGTVASWRAKGDELDKQIEQLAQQQGQAEGAAQGRDAIKARIADLEQLIQQGQDVDLEAMKKDQAAELKQLKADVAELDKELKEATDKKLEARGNNTLAHDRTTAAEAAVDTIQAQIDEHQQRIERVQHGGGQCPLIPDKACDALKDPALLDQMNAWADTLQADLVKAQDEVKAAKTKEEASHRLMQHPAKVAREVQAKATRAEAKLDELPKQHAQALADAEAKLAEVERLVSELDTKRGELLALPDNLADEGIAAQLEGLRTEKAQAILNADTLTDNAAAVAERLKHQKELDDAVDKRDEIRDLLRDLGPKGLLGRILADAFGPLVGQVNHYLKPITGSTIWFDADGGLSLGYSRPTIEEGKVPLETASESHAVVISTIVAAVVLSKLDGWRHLAIDGLEVLSKDRTSNHPDLPPRRDGLVLALVAMCNDGLLDDCWLASVDDGWQPPEGVHWHQMGGQP